MKFLTWLRLVRRWAGCSTFRRGKASWPSLAFWRMVNRLILRLVWRGCHSRSLRIWDVFIPVCVGPRPQSNILLYDELRVYKPWIWCPRCTGVEISFYKVWSVKSGYPLLKSSVYGLYDYSTWDLCWCQNQDMYGIVFLGWRIELPNFYFCWMCLRAWVIFKTKHLSALKHIGLPFGQYIMLKSLGVKVVDNFAIRWHSRQRSNGHWDETLSGKSLMNNKKKQKQKQNKTKQKKKPTNKNKGPKTVPWGTPDLTEAQSEWSPLIATLCCLSLTFLIRALNDFANGN